MPREMGSASPNSKVMVNGIDKYANTRVPGLPTYPDDSTVRYTDFHNEYSVQIEPTQELLTSK